VLLETLVKAEGMAPSHLCSHGSTNHITPLSFAC